MIPFASERGLGQDLATHLLNEHDNEEMELAELRGAVAQDLHGAFAEWEFQAHARTKCKNYLFSLSVNPWEVGNGRLSREQYFEYLGRAEERLGLSGQPRAVVFHIKDGREHCHVVWSRIDTDQGKAVHLPFFKDTMMMVTREFAREHSLELPKGYEKYRDGKSKQLSLYEMHQQRVGGLSKEEHREQVTDAWRMSDSSKAFVQALADHGYILATGKRPYVLVDLYGHMNALPKLIDDKTVRTKDIRAFLEAEFSPESLPTVEEARAVAAEHRKALEGHLEHEQKTEALAELKVRQEARRGKLKKQQAALGQRRHSQRQRLLQKQKVFLADHRATFVEQIKRIRQERYERRPQGLAAFLGRVTGVEIIRKKLHKYQDRKNHEAYLKERTQLREQQKQQRRKLQYRQQMQSLNMDRKFRALGKIERRERQSLEQLLGQETRIQARGGRAQLPPLDLEPKRYGRGAAPDRAKEYDPGKSLLDPFKDAHDGIKPSRKVNLADDFERAAQGEQGGDDGGSSDGPKPESSSKVDRYRRQKKGKNHGRDKDRGR